MIGAFGHNLGTHSQQGGIDPILSAFWAAGSITDADEKAADTQLLADLKGEGSTTNNSNILSKFYAIYPVSPTSLAAAGINFLNPGTFDATWYNSPTHGTTGVTGNGSNTYGDTGFNPSTDATSINDFGLTADVSDSDAANKVDIGVNDGSTYIQLNINNGTYTYITGTLTSFVSGTTGTLGVRTSSRRASNDLEGYLNGVSDGIDTSLAGSFPNYDVFLMCANGSGTPSTATARRYRFWAIHKGLTDNEAQDLYDAITTYNANVISGGR